MKSGRVSQTALKVGLIMITLNEKAGWKPRLLEGLVELTERLILAAGVIQAVSLRQDLQSKGLAAGHIAGRRPQSYQAILKSIAPSEFTSRS